MCCFDATYLFFCAYCIRVENWRNKYLIEENNKFYQYFYTFDFNLRGIKKRGLVVMKIKIDMVKIYA